MPWFRRADGYEIKVPDREFEDTVERLRREGWTEIPDPASVPASAAVPAPDLLTPPESERAALPQTTPDTIPDTRPEPASEPAQPVTRPVTRPVLIRATAKVGGRKKGSGQISPQMRAKQWPKKTTVKQQEVDRQEVSR